MSIADNISKRINNGYYSVGKRLFGWGKDSSQNYSIYSNYSGTNKYSNYLNTYEGIVYACVNAIAEEMGGYRPKLMRSTEDNLSEIKQHPWLQLLSNPQPEDAEGISQYDLFEAHTSFMLLQGECFWYLPYGELTGKPKEIHILPSQQMGVSVDDNGDVDGYYLRRNNGKPIPFEVKEILHFKRFNPNNPYRGLSIIEAGLDYIETEDATTKYTKNFFKNNAGLSGVLSVNGEVTKNAFKKFSRQWREKYQGVDNAGKVAIVRDSDATFTKVGLGLNELDMESLKKMSKDDVFMMFRTPKGLFGLSDDSGLGRASVETLEYIFAKRTIDPMMKKLDSMMLKALRKYYPKEPVAEVQHVNVIPADKEYDLKYRDTAVDRWITRDEIRERDGLESKSADNLYVEFNKMPVDETNPSTSKSIKFVKTTTTKDEHQHTKSEVKNTDPEFERKENFRLRLEKNKNVYTKKYYDRLAKLLDEQKKIVFSNLAQFASKNIADQLFDLSDANDNIEKGLYPILRSIVLEQGGIALEFAGDNESTFILREAIDKAVRNSLSRMASNMNKMTLEKLGTTLTEGIRNGESLGKLKKRVTEVYDQAKGYRAERIARTESGFATGEATLDAYRQTGYVVGKQWFANPGACEFCESLNGTSVGLEDSFVSVGQSVEGESGNVYDVTYGDVTSAELHPNCNCTIIPVRESQSSIKSKKEAQKLNTQIKKLEKKLKDEQQYSAKLEDMVGLDEAKPKN